MPCDAGAVWASNYRCDSGEQEIEKARVNTAPFLDITSGGI
jgi:hypothetical protein